MIIYQANDLAIELSLKGLIKLYPKDRIIKFDEISTINQLPTKTKIEWHNFESKLFNGQFRFTFQAHAHSDKFAGYSVSDFIVKIQQLLIALQINKKSVITIDLIGCEAGFVSQKGESYAQLLSDRIITIFPRIQVKALSNLIANDAVAVNQVIAIEPHTGVTTISIFPSESSRYLFLKYEPIKKSIFIELEQIKQAFYQLGDNIGTADESLQPHLISQLTLYQSIIDCIEDFQTALNASADTYKKIIFTTDDVRKSLDNTPAFKFSTKNRQINNIPATFSIDEAVLAQLPEIVKEDAVEPALLLEMLIALNRNTAEAFLENFNIESPQKILDDSNLKYQASKHLLNSAATKIGSAALTPDMVALSKMVWPNIMLLFNTVLNSRMKLMYSIAQEIKKIDELFSPNAMNIVPIFEMNEMVKKREVLYDALMNIQRNTQRIFEYTNQATEILLTSLDLSLTASVSLSNNASTLFQQAPKLTNEAPHETKKNQPK